MSLICTAFTKASSILNALKYDSLFAFANELYYIKANLSETDGYCETNLAMVALKCHDIV